MKYLLGAVRPTTSIFSKRHIGTKTMLKLLRQVTEPPHLSNFAAGQPILQDECEKPHLEHHSGQHPIREGQWPLVLQNAPHRLPHPDLDRALRQVLRHHAGLHHVHRGRHNACHKARNLQERGEGGKVRTREGGRVSKGGTFFLGAFTRRVTMLPRGAFLHVHGSRCNACCEARNLQEHAGGRLSKGRMSFLALSPEELLCYLHAAYLHVQRGRTMLATKPATCGDQVGLIFRCKNYVDHS